MAYPAQRSDLRRMSVEEFLSWNSGDDLTYELVEGWPVAQSAPSSSHGVMTVNAALALRSRLQRAGHPCTVESGSGLRITGKASVRAPDLLVRCGSRLAGEGQPLLAVEVLSPSNSAQEMGDKRDDYLLTGIREVAEISQDRALVRIYRHADDVWTIYTVIGLSSMLRLESLGLELPLSELYEGVAFAPGQDESAAEA